MVGARRTYRRDPLNKTRFVYFCIKLDLVTVVPVKIDGRLGNLILFLVHSKVPWYFRLGDGEFSMSDSGLPGTLDPYCGNDTLTLGV